MLVFCFPVEFVPLHTFSFAPINLCVGKRSAEQSAQVHLELLDNTLNLYIEATPHQHLTPRDQSVRESWKAKGDSHRIIMFITLLIQRVQWHWGHTNPSVADLSDILDILVCQHRISRITTEKKNVLRCQSIKGDEPLGRPSIQSFLSCRKQRSIRVWPYRTHLRYLRNKKVSLIFWGWARKRSTGQDLAMNYKLSIAFGSV